MNELYVVVEGRHDVELLRKYLPALPGAHLRFFAGNGRVSVSTIARNLLVHEQGGVLIVMDADSLDPKQAEQHRSMALATLRSLSEGFRFDAFAFVPEHEVVLFEAPQVLRAHWDAKELTPAVLERGSYSPKKTLEALLRPSGRTMSSWLSTLTPDDGDELRKGAQAAALVSRLCSMLDPALSRKSA